MKNKLSVVLATRNEEANIARCLNSVVGLADEIVIFDESSTDKTVEIAKGYGAQVVNTPHNENFHITKKAAIEHALGPWILLLDADESLSSELKSEILQVLSLSQEKINSWEVNDPRKKRLFSKHSKLLDLDDAHKDENVYGFFLPRLNMFLGKKLIHGGVYPDGVIRLFHKSHARLPAVHVHEQVEVDGRVLWLSGDLLHWDSPSLNRYFSRLGRYTDINVTSYKKKSMPVNFTTAFSYLLLRPIASFVRIYVRHKGFLDGVNGLLWALFSASHYPISYIKYIIRRNETKR